MNLNLCDIRTVKQVMTMFGISFRKEFGQNFLTDRFAVEDIADLCCESGNEPRTVLEIGPGIGTLTRELAARYENVICLEIDTGLIPVLRYTLEDFKNVRVINEDVMKADLDAILGEEFEKGGVSVCANLPYYITTPILMRLLECGLPFDYITVMVQKEVAERLCAAPGSKNCGAITAVLNYYGTADLLFTVTPDKFIPAPKVSSSVLRIKLHKEKPCNPDDLGLFFRVIKASFEQRRKTLLNSLSSGFPEIEKKELSALIESSGISPEIRGERLTLDNFKDLSNAIGRRLLRSEADK